tara:strand:- start:472 stop:960 length:489 start_codon:yes stop_codon:yes gene_type:complete
MRVIAIDPGYERIGIAIIEKKENKKEKVLFSECFQTNKDLDFNKRLYLVGDHIRTLIQEYEPIALATEDLFFAKNTKTALKVSESRGVIAFQASDNGIPIYEYTPNQIKVAVTGYGRASKKDIYTMVSRLVSLSQAIKMDDEIDAIAIGLTFFASYKQKSLR